MKLYNISADGKTWTTQWLTEQDVEEHKKLGYIVTEKIFEYSTK